MIKILFSLLLCLLTCSLPISAQETSSLEQHAETAEKNGKPIEARYTYIRAFEDYTAKGQMKKGVECGVKATTLYYKDHLWKEAFELLRRVEQTIFSSNKTEAQKATLRYLTTKERYNMYTRLHKTANAKEQMGYMEILANRSDDEEVKNDMLYHKAIYHYSIGQTTQGNAVFKQMADKMMTSKDYDKIDEVYQTLIATGRRSGSANMVAQSYSSYMAWKDSTNALKAADRVNALKKQIADNEASIEEKDSKLTTRQAIIIGLGILAAILAAVLVIGAIILMRFIILTKKQKKTINRLDENNNLKAVFISNIAAQLEPTLKKLDSKQPEVRALQDFAEHIQTLSDLENTTNEEVELTETQVQPFCEALIDGIRNKVKPGVILKVDAPKMGAKINKDYVTHILEHLLNNAVNYVSNDGKIVLEFKKRSAHTFQFLVTNNGETIAEEEREEVFKAFRKINDLTEGDGLGLPICKQMALKMNGDLEIDPTFSKGTRFILTLRDA